MIPFEPHPLLRNAHLMTLAASFWPRRLSRLSPAIERLFEVEPGSRILAQCHWQSEPRRHPTLALVHGLEGSSRSPYMLGVAGKAFASGFNVLRLNQRNCGGTEHLTPKLYNSGLSDDYRAVLFELVEHDALPEVFFAGYSMGGNLVLKMAGELGDRAPGQLRAVCGVAAALDLAACADAIALPRNLLYQWHFVQGLKQRMRRKARLFPGRYGLNGLGSLRTLRQFDDAITAPYSGYRDADDYYDRASALRVLAEIRVPTLIVAAQDDPFVPFATFRDPAIAANSRITLVAPSHGGHCGFISRTGGEERFWAEARLVEYCQQHSELAKRREAKKSEGP
jgi:predicted alpha/beta-fold hydrolase